MVSAQAYWEGNGLPWDFVQRQQPSASGANILAGTGWTADPWRSTAGNTTSSSLGVQVSPGWGLGFDDDAGDWLQYNTPPQLSGNNMPEMSCYAICTLDHVAGNQQQRVITFGNADSEAFMFWVDEQTSILYRIGLRINPTGGADSDLGVYDFSLPTGESYLGHFCATYSDPTGKTYIDGYEVASSNHASGGSTDALSSTYEIGRRYGDATNVRAYDGVICFTALFDRALHAKEVELLYKDFAGLLTPTRKVFLIPGPIGALTATAGIASFDFLAFKADTPNKRQVGISTFDLLGIGASSLKRIEAGISVHDYLALGTAGRKAVTAGISTADFLGLGTTALKKAQAGIALHDYLGLGASVPAGQAAAAGVSIFDFTAFGLNPTVTKSITTGISVHDYLAFGAPVSKAGQAFAGIAIFDLLAIGLGTPVKETSSGISVVDFLGLGTSSAVHATAAGISRVDFSGLGTSGLKKPIAGISVFDLEGLGAATAVKVGAGIAVVKFLSLGGRTVVLEVVVDHDAFITDVLSLDVFIPDEVSGDAFL
jgi:hypothetical protein